MSTSTFAADRIARIRGTQKSVSTTETRAKSARRSEATREQKTRTKPSPFAGLCCLCGMPAKHRYCHAHSWAEGT